MHLEALATYPVKSCRALYPETSRVEPRGLHFDRRWMVVDQAGRFLSQRECSLLATIQPALADDHLGLRCGESAIQIPFGTGFRRDVRIWNDTVEALDAGAAAASWLESVLTRPARLIEMPDDCQRRVDLRYASDGEITSFADGFPFLLLNLASLDALNDRILENGGEPVEWSRFRPNFVIAGAGPWEEDGWGRFRIGECEFEVVKPCTRCLITTLDQQTGESLGNEPLRTLASFRKWGNGVVFAQNLLPRRLGRVRVGDELEIV